MPMTGKGLVKLLEELSELGQVAAKKLAYFSVDEHPDGAGPLSGRMEQEMGDAAGSMAFVQQQFGLDGRAIEVHAGERLALLRAPMSVTGGGLVQLHNSLGRLAQVAAQKLDRSDVDSHLNQPLESAMGELAGAMAFVQLQLGLDGHAIEERACMKLAVFQLWHADPDNGAVSFDAPVPTVPHPAPAASRADASDAVDAAVPHGCHCDLEPDQSPDGCVIDEGRPQDCSRSSSGQVRAKEQCREWRPIQLTGEGFSKPRRASGSTIPDGVVGRPGPTIQLQEEA